MKLLRNKLSSDKYFTLINSYLDSIVSIQQKNFSRIDLVKYINQKASQDSQISLVDIEVTFLVKDFYFNQATDKQKQLLSLYLVNDHIESERAIDPLAVDTTPIALFYDNLISQKTRLNSLLTELEQKTPSLSIDSFNSNLENLEKIIEQLVVKKVISLTGSSKVDAVYDYALSVYDTHIQMIQAYQYMKKEVQRLFNDFSELRDNLRYAREDFFFLTSSVLEQKLDTQELSIFDFETVKWLEYAEIQDRLDLQFDKVSEHCTTFYSTLSNNFVGVANSLSDGFDTIGSNMNKKNYGKDDLKADLIATGISTAFSAISGIFKSRTDSKLTIENLYKEIELLKLGFTEDKIKLQTDLIRLIELFNSVKNNFIPVTKKYNDIFFNVIENNFTKDLKITLTTNGIDLKINERSELLAELRYLDLYLEDRKHICKELEKPLSIAEDKYLQQKNYYHFTLNQEPNKVSDLVLVLTLGWASAYKDIYHDEWVKAKQPVEDLYYKLKKDYEKQHSFWKRNNDSYTDLKNRKPIIIDRLKQLDSEIKKALHDSSFLNNFLDKKALLINIANSSRVVLETSIHENLLSPENFADSINMVIDTDQLINDSITIYEDSLEALDTNHINVYAKVNSLIEQLEKTPSLDTITNDLSLKLYQNVQDQDISQEEIKEVLDTVVNHYNLDNLDFSYNNFQEKLVNNLVSKTPLNYDQVNELIDLTKYHFQTMEQVINIRQEVKTLRNINHTNDQQINDQMKILIQKSIGKIYKENEKTNELLSKLNDQNLSDLDKLNLFN